MSETWKTVLSRRGPFHVDPDKQSLRAKYFLISSIILSGTQKNCLIEMALLSTHKIYFGSELLLIFK